MSGDALIFALAGRFFLRLQTRASTKIAESGGPEKPCFSTFVRDLHLSARGHYLGSSRDLDWQRCRIFDALKRCTKFRDT
jgi:hypothetical protein